MDVDSRFGCKVLLVASAVKAAVYLLLPEERSALLLTVMTPHGLGVLSLR